jgi:hypothetical protein
MTVIDKTQRAVLIALSLGYPQLHDAYLCLGFVSLPVAAY